MAAEVLTYTSLLTDIQVYTDRDDTPFITQIPRFVMLAENRIAKEVKQLGFKRFVTDNMQVGVSIIAKPARWRETVSFNIGTGTTYNARTPLYERTYEWCRAYCPDPTVTSQPKYYGDYDSTHFIIAGTPNYTYPFELVYFERPEPLSIAHQTSWTTENAPELLLFACLLETSPFLKSDERTQMWQALYDRAAQNVTHEDNQRVTDRSSGVK